MVLKQIADETLERIDQMIKLELESSKIPGLSIGIYQNNRSIWFKGYGVADLQKKTPLTPQSVYRLASISKIFTTIGILQLKDTGKLQLDDPINKYLPSGKIIVKKGWPEVTFRHLLTHTSGIGELPRKRDVFKAPGFGLNVKAPKEIPPLASIHQKPVYPEVKAGTKYAYSNYAFSLLGFLIECISGLEFSDYMRQKIFKPLEMTLSDFDRSEKIISHEVQGYAVKLMNPKKLKHATYWQSIIRPAGALYSCIEDIGKFGAGLIEIAKNSASTEKQILNPESLLESWTPQYYAHPKLKEKFGIGLGFHIFHPDQVPVMEHNGATSGFTTCFDILPEQELTVVVFGNLDEIFHKDKTLKIKNRIIQILLEYLSNSNGQTSSAKKQETMEKTEENSLFLGSYDPLRGVLTNTRLYQAGGEFYLTQKEVNGQKKLIFASLYDSLRKGKELSYDSTVGLFYYELKPGGNLYNKSYFVFDLDPDTKKPMVAWNLYRLFKRSKIFSKKWIFYFFAMLLIGIIILVLV